LIKFEEPLTEKEIYELVAGNEDEVVSEVEENNELEEIIEEKVNNYDVLKGFKAISTWLEQSEHLNSDNLGYIAELKSLFTDDTESKKNQTKLDRYFNL
jgi:hypothetical protein